MQLKPAAPVPVKPGFRHVCPAIVRNGSVTFSRAGAERGLTL
jgi:hypothetical protein